MARLLEDLSLEVKAYVQPLGVENAWTDLGEGVVEIVGNTVRVRPHAPPSVTAEDCDGDEEAAKRLAGAMESLGAEEPLLEDELEGETQLVGRDTCIVWNSPAQELSFCIMFASEMGFEATHAAFQFVIHQRREGWTLDLFAEMMEQTPSPAVFAANIASELESASALGFIERHAIVCAFIGGDYAAVPGVIANPDVSHALLGLHHPEIIEYLIHDDRFNAFAKAASQPASNAASPSNAGDGESSSTPPPASPASSSSAASAFTSWTIPEKLRALPLCDDIQRVLTRVLRLHALRPTKGPAEANPIVETLEAVATRQLGALVLQLAADEEFLRALGDGLNAACEPGPTEDPEAAEQHLRCLADVLEITTQTHGREALSAAVRQVFEASEGLLGLAGAAKLLRRQFHARLHAAFCRVLDTTLVLLNHKGDEVTMAAVFRDPIVAAASSATGGRPDVLAPFMAYLVHTCVTPAAECNEAAAAATEEREMHCSRKQQHQQMQQSAGVSVGAAASSTESEAGADAPADGLPMGASGLGVAKPTHSPRGGFGSPRDGALGSATGAATSREAKQPVALAFTSMAAFLPASGVALTPVLRSSPRASADASRRASNTTNTPFGPEGCGHGPQYLFHLLGLHDDEGTTVDRAPTAESVESRAAIQRHMTSAHVYPLLQACRAAGAIPEAVSNMLEYLLRLTPPDNRDRLLHLLLSSRSPLVKLLASHSGGRNKAELCAGLRLLRSLLTAMLALPRKELAPLAHRITFGTDLWAVYTERLGRDRRGRSMAQCVFNSVVDLLSVQNSNNPASDTLEPIRKYVMLRHRAALPPRFVSNVEAAELAALASELQADGFASPVPFVSPSRACTPGLDTSSQRRARVAEEVLPPEQRQSQLTTKLRTLASNSRRPSAGSTGSSSPSGSPNASPIPAPRSASGPAAMSLDDATVMGTSSNTATEADRAKPAPRPLSAGKTVADPAPPTTEPPTGKPRRPVAPLVGRKAGRRPQTKPKLQVS